MTAHLPMTTGRIMALVIGVPLALVIIGWTALTEVAYAGQASYPVRLDIPVRGQTVRVAVDSGDVAFTQAAGHVLRITGTARYSLVRSTTIWHSTSSGVTVLSQCHFVTGVCSFGYHATLPAGMPAFVSDSSGNVTLRGLSGAVNVQDGSGDVSGTALSGPRAVFQGDSGNITVTGLASADVKVSDNSGDIALTFTRVPGHVWVSDDSGNVTLVLPAGNTLYRVSASSSSGSTGIHVPTSSASAHRITVTDGSGDISIRQ
jgi:hypothetical protein